MNAADPGGAVLDGATFYRMVEAGTRFLERHADAINALNVFPVPDGDTGINMLLTLRAATDPSAAPAPDASLAEVSAGVARRALLGARGNSGVIFSQFLRGLADGLVGRAACDGDGLRSALEVAAAAGYQAVGKPVEGTMLTVMRVAAEAARAADGTPAGILRVARGAAADALAHTPEQLPILKEAGVVDAGGQGVVVFLEGALAYLEGREPAIEISVPAGAAGGPAVRADYLEHTADEMYGFCTQFVIAGAGLDLQAIRRGVQAIASSTVVIGDEGLVRIHAHAPDPGPLLSLGVRLGDVDQIKIDNMDAMHTAFMARHGQTVEQRAVGVVAVAAGDGLVRLFRELGATVVHGGQTMNPSAADLIAAGKRAHVAHVLFLPNNPNVILAAEQASRLTDVPCTVVPSRSIPQGIAALLAFNPELDAPANAERMTAAMRSVRSGEVTTAARSTRIGGVDVAAGQAIGLLDDKIACACASPRDALETLTAAVAPGDGALITLYAGSETPGEQAARDADSLRARWPGVQVEVVDGGQPHYHYLVSFE